MSAVSILLFLLLTNASAGAVRCGDDPGDGSAIADARAEVETRCNCTGAATHGAYVRCAAGVAKERADGGMLRRECMKAVKRCAARSTCGKPGFVTCCRVDAKGLPRSCTIRSEPGRCAPPAGGSACAGVLPSCCDACAEDGSCVTATTTPTTTTTSSTLRSCVGDVSLDPDGTITALPRSTPADVPVRATSSTGGLFDVFLEDGGAGGQVTCPPAGCSMGMGVPAGGSTTVHFTYAAASGAPPTVTLTAHLSPHSIGFTCSPSSSGDTDAKTFPVSP